MDREHLPWWLRRVARQLSHFEVLSLDVDPWRGVLTSDDITAELGAGRADGADPVEARVAAEVRSALQEEGTLVRLRERGFEPEFTFRQDEAGRHVLRIVDGRDGALLAEAVARFARVRPRVDPARWGLGEHLNVIVLDWLLLQDPRASFTPERPPLPGQHHPGLGAGARALGLLDMLARRLERDAVLAFPSHYHNAVLAQATFSFVDPHRQGELAALERDLSGLGLAEASWAIELGLVTEPAGTVFRWSAEEMAHPTSAALEGHLTGKAYEHEAQRVADTLHFEVDAEAARDHVARLVRAG